MTMQDRSLVEVDSTAALHARNPFADVHEVGLARMLAATTHWTEREGLLHRVAGARRLEAWARSMVQETLVVLAGVEEQRTLHTCGDGTVVATRDAVVAEIALATCQSEADVRRELATARTIERTLPAVRDALHSGVIDGEKAYVIARTADRLPTGTHEDLQRELLSAAGCQSLHELKTTAEVQVRALDPYGAEARRLRAARKRSVWLGASEDGNTMLHARLASMDAHACLRVLTDAAAVRRDEAIRHYVLAGEEAPTRGMLQAEELVSRILARGAESGAVAVELQVQVDVATLAGLRDDPVVMDGSAVTDVVALREWIAACGDVTLRRLIVDSADGSLLDLGRTAYRASTQLRRFIVARDGRCIWPRCPEPANQADLDHATPWEQGGITSADNLNALCRRHHLLKTFDGYRLITDSHGAWHLVTPSGEIVATGNRALPRAREPVEGPD